MPAAAMFTEQNPPCAAWLGVPKFCAQKLVKLCDWSRPVKKASFDGSVLRMGSSQSVAICSASSHEISSNAPAPRGPTRFSGARRRDGALTCMMPADPLAQSTPLFTG